MQIKMFNALLIMDPAVTLLIHYVGDRYSGGGSDNTSQRGRRLPMYYIIISQNVLRKLKWSILVIEK